MTVEAMWKFQSGSVGSEDTPVWGGIVVLESGRVFGGDSLMAYLGTYEVDRGKITAHVRSWAWNTDVPAEEFENVFGMTSDIDHNVVLEGEISGNEIHGVLRSDKMEGVELKSRMIKIADLP
ncbi:GrlR family regulatory protein [Novosphingobium guangzhouense]|uniref:Uncharacterized protein n=1 Tax=Novosphingobium guangzhouense TaxID=1850347 RepID=A0A2K2FWG0_9SPHN|nr:GrlR family regulatory protein [Novosphingobium guangzhouense]PNU03126.1 hypothetical protein A8V01_24905 [Novosphingobium guangzhouense]